MIYCVIIFLVSTESSDASYFVQGVNVRNNPFVLLTLLVISAFLYFGESSSPTKVELVKAESLSLKKLVLETSFNAHDLDESARSIVLKGNPDTRLQCRFFKGEAFKNCKVGEKISWTPEAYQKGFKFIVKDNLGNIKSFSPKKYNPFLSFHKCDVLFKKGASEASFRETLRDIRDLNQDQMKILCLEEGVVLTVKNGPFIITKDMAIIGTHSNSAKFLSGNVKEVFKNEKSSLFLYNLNIETKVAKTTGISLGVGSYLGANNLKIKTDSHDSKGINCFGCTIDGEDLEVLTTSIFTTAIESSLGLIELRRSSLHGAIGLLSKMGSNINLIDGTLLVTNLKLRDN